MERKQAHSDARQALPIYWKRGDNLTNNICQYWQMLLVRLSPSRAKGLCHGPPPAARSERPEGFNLRREANPLATPPLKTALQGLGWISISDEKPAPWRLQCCHPVT